MDTRIDHSENHKDRNICAFDPENTVTSTTADKTDAGVRIDMDGKHQSRSHSSGRMEAGNVLEDDAKAWPLA